MRQETKLCIAAAAGILSHTLIFIRNEHHIQAPQLFRFFCLLLPLFLFISEARLWALSDLAHAARASALILLSYSASLFTSIVIYRIFFHELRKFPGPIGARVSKFWREENCWDSPTSNCSMTCISNMEILFAPVRILASQSSTPRINC